MMDRTAVGQETSNRGETTVLAGLSRDRKLVVVEYPQWAGWPVTRKVMWEPKFWRGIPVSWY
jgi:hypothetical protein